MDRFIRQTNDKAKLTTTRMGIERMADMTLDDAIPGNQYGFTAQTQRCANGAWFGNIGNWENAQKLFADGWLDGAARAAGLRRTLDGLIPSGTITRRARKTSDTGDDLRLDAALVGDWDNAFDCRVATQQRDSNVISIAAGWIAPCTISHDDLLWNAVQLIVLCDALEDAGWRVEVRAIDGTTTYSLHKYRQLIDITIKRSEDPMRSDLVAATFGHAGVYRTLGFAAMWMVPKQQQDSLGKCWGDIDARKTIDEAVAANMISPVSLYLPRADSEDKAKTNLRAAIAKLFPESITAAA